jgi:DNA-binding NtrC family response regulator
MNGVEAFRLIHKINPDTPVILMTGYSDEDLEELAMREGARCVMHKPLRVDKMIEIIKDAASESPGSSSINEPYHTDRTKSTSIQGNNQAAMVSNR